MKRQLLNISGYQYLVEYYTNTEVSKYEQFYMIRDFDYANNIAYDKTIMFIDSTTFELLKEELKTKEYIDTVVFPIVNDKHMIYKFSKSFRQFNNNLTKESFLSVNTEDDLHEVYPIYRKFNTGGDIKMKMANIKLDMIKLYHPSNKINMDAFVYIDNYINNIHFIYLCRPWKYFNYNSENEIKIENRMFSEYLEIYFPNFIDLFNKTYYVENINPIYLDEESNILSGDEFKIKVNLEDSNISSKNKKFIEDHIYFNNGELYSSLDLLIQPWILNKRNNLETNNETLYYKWYIKSKFENSLFNIPINILVFPYKKFNNADQYTYLSNDQLTQGNVSFINEFQFSLISNLEFDDHNNHTISIGAHFDYPKVLLDYISHDDQDEYTNILEELYCKIYNIKDKNIYDIKNQISNIIQDSPTFSPEHLEVYQNILELQPYVYSKMDDIPNDIKYKTIETYKNLSQNELKVINFELGNNVNNPKYFDVPQIIYKKYQLDLQNILDVDNVDELLMPYIGYRIDISSDGHFNNIIYSNYFPIHPTIINGEVTSLNITDRVIFNINNILKSYKDKPEFLVAKVLFIDRYIGISLVSNTIIISDDWYPYILSDNHNLDQLDLKNNNYIEDMKVISLNDNDNTFNFFNNINCIVKKEVETNPISGSSSSSNIIYKPIFFKVNSLSNIQIRENIEQNIGIDLFNVMTKVNKFKLKLEDEIYYEYGRQNQYVLFKINASKLTKSSGKFDIFDESDRYISTGNYSIV